MRRHNAGFTLLEMLLATILLTVGSVSLLQAINSGLFAGGINETELVATYLAQEQIESIRNTAYASIIPVAKAPVPGFTAFQRQVFVDNNVPVTNMKRVTVSVYYTVKSSELTMSMVTYVSNT